MSDDKEKKELERQTWLNGLTVVIKEIFSSYEQSLKGFGDIRQFFTTEQDFWKAVESDVQSKNISHDSRINNLANYYRDCLNRLNTFRNEIDSVENKQQFDQKWNNIVGILNNPRSYRGDLSCAYSKSLIGIFIAKLYRENPNFGDGAFKYFLKEGINYNRSQELVGFIRACDFDRPANENQKHQRESLNGIRSEWEQKTHDLKSEFENKKTELYGWKKEFVDENEQWKISTKDDIVKYLDEKKNEFKNLGTSYENLLKLEAPVRYWRTRAKSYRHRGWIWVAALTGIVLITVLLLTMILYNLPSAFHKKLFAGEPEAIKGLIIFATMLSFLVYLSRVFSRMIFSSFHIERDAEEREQLTYVYLALIKSGGITDKEREIVLQSLFSRVETGLLGVDSSPTMPVAVSDILNQTGRK